MTTTIATGSVAGLVNFGADQPGTFSLSTDTSGLPALTSNGEPVLFRVAFKPPATIGLPQQTVDYQGRPVTLEAKGRHDPCVVPRAVPIVEAMTALVLADLALQQTSRTGAAPRIE